MSGYGEWNDVSLLMSTAVAMFLFAYSSLSITCYFANVNFKGVHILIWSMFLIYTLYFWNFVVPFFQMSNLVSCITVLGIVALG